MHKLLRYASPDKPPAIFTGSTLTRTTCRNKGRKILRPRKRNSRPFVQNLGIQREYPDGSRSVANTKP
ncbi:MAG TPA: hypothetical protein VGP72_09110 [Planctomycetota bacterium]